MKNSKKQHSNGSTIGKFAFLVFGVWFVLVLFEWVAIKNLDKQIRSKPNIFLSYTQKLPEFLVQWDIGRQGLYIYCEEQSVGVLWNYQICTGFGASSPSCESTPYFYLLYFRPTQRLFPDGNPWVRSPLALEADKTICIQNDISEDI